MWSNAVYDVGVVRGKPGEIVSRTIWKFVACLERMLTAGKWRKSGQPAIPVIPGKTAINTMYTYLQTIYTVNK